MSTIYTRAGKGSALTWAEGDANITNLNNDKLQNVVEDTTPQLGGSLDVNGQSIVSLSNGNITISPNGTGNLVLDGQNWPQADGTANYVLKTNGSGQLSWAAPSFPTSPITSAVSIYTSYGNNLNIGTASGIDGDLYLNQNLFPKGSGTDGYVLKTDGAGTLDWVAQASAFDPASPGAIGSTTASTGAFTTLSATGTTTLATSLTGVLKAASGVVSAATAGTDFVAVNGALGTPSSGNLSNTTVDGTNGVGFRGIPSAGVQKTTGYSLTTADRGEFVQVGSGGSITVPNSTFSAGDVVIIYNNHTAAITIALSTTNAYLAGTNTNRTSATLATRGVCNILFVSSTVAILSGNLT